MLYQQVFAVLCRDITQMFECLYLLFGTLDLTSLLASSRPATVALKHLLRRKRDGIRGLRVSENAVAVKVGAIRILRLFVAYLAQLQMAHDWGMQH